MDSFVTNGLSFIVFKFMKRIAVKEGERYGRLIILKESIKINALNMAEILKNTPEIQELILNKKIDVQAGYYSIKSGRVEILKNKEIKTNLK